MPSRRIRQNAQALHERLGRIPLDRSRHQGERPLDVALRPLADVGHFHQDGAGRLGPTDVVQAGLQQVQQFVDAPAVPVVRRHQVGRRVPGNAPIEQDAQLPQGLGGVGLGNQAGSQQPHGLVDVVQVLPRHLGQFGLQAHALPVRAGGGRDFHADHVGQIHPPVGMLVGPVQPGQGLAVVAGRVDDLDVALGRARVVPHEVFVQPPQAHADVPGLAVVPRDVDPPPQDAFQAAPILALQGDVFQEVQGLQVAGVQVQDPLQHVPGLVVEQQPPLEDLPQFQQKALPEVRVHHGRGDFLQQARELHPEAAGLGRGAHLVQDRLDAAQRHRHPRRVHARLERPGVIVQLRQHVVQAHEQVQALGRVGHRGRQIPQDRRHAVQVALLLAGRQQPPPDVHQAVIQREGLFQVASGPRHFAQVLLAGLRHGQVQGHAARGVRFLGFALGQQRDERPQVLAAGEHPVKGPQILLVQVDLLQAPGRDVVRGVDFQHALEHLARAGLVAQLVGQDLAPLVHQFDAPTGRHRPIDLLRQEAGVVVPPLQARVQLVHVLAGFPRVRVRDVQFLVQPQGLVIAQQPVPGHGRGRDQHLLPLGAGQHRQFAQVHRVQFFLVVLVLVDRLQSLDHGQVFRVQFQDLFQERDRLRFVRHSRDGDFRDLLEQVQQFGRVLGHEDLLLQHLQQIGPPLAVLVAAGQRFQGLLVRRRHLDDAGVGRQDVVGRRQAVRVLVDFDDLEQRRGLFLDGLGGKAPQAVVVEFDQGMPLAGALVQVHQRGLGLAVRRVQGQHALPRLDGALGVLEVLLGHGGHRAVDADALGRVLDHRQQELQRREQRLEVPAAAVVVLVEPQGRDVARVDGPQAPPGAFRVVGAQCGLVGPGQDRQQTGFLGSARGLAATLFQAGQGLGAQVQAVHGRHPHVQGPGVGAIDRQRFLGRCPRPDVVLQGVVVHPRQVHQHVGALMRLQEVQPPAEPELDLVGTAGVHQGAGHQGQGLPVPRRGFQVLIQQVDHVLAGAARGHQFAGLGHAPHLGRLAGAALLPGLQGLPQQSREPGLHRVVPDGGQGLDQADARLLGKLGADLVEQGRQRHGVQGLHGRGGPGGFGRLDVHEVRSEQVGGGRGQRPGEVVRGGQGPAVQQVRRQARPGRDVVSLVGQRGALVHAVQRFPQVVARQPPRHPVERLDRPAARCHVVQQPTQFVDVHPHLG